ncbi:unnamed protein product [Penicillium camemberti]|uniref:Str. FM013 n=1 Tax=Penicillium camemberti (strain FM 013) TaxID=1429867 RepID=A0A0G4PS34_PENC3|nr:unnamed protein product [Penicillium camemberti]
MYEAGTLRRFLSRPRTDRRVEGNVSISTCPSEYNNEHDEREHQNTQVLGNTTN